MDDRFGPEVSDVIIDNDAATLARRDVSLAFSSSPRAPRLPVSTSESGDGSRETIALLLGVLAVFDFVLAGFRSVAGRDGRVRKQPMFRAAMIRGGAWGLAVVGAHAAVAGILVATGDATTWPAMVDAGRDAVIVCGGFATATLLALAFWFAPIQELRLVPTLIVLGPLTLLWPLVIAGGLAWAAVRSDEPRVWILAGCAGISMLCAERVLGRPYRERWKRLLAS